MSILSEPTTMHQQGTGLNLRVQCVPCGDRYLTFANDEANDCICTAGDGFYPDCVFDTSRCDACGATFWEDANMLVGFGADGEEIFEFIQDDDPATGDSDEPVQFRIYNDDVTFATLPAYYSE